MRHIDILNLKPTDKMLAVDPIKCRLPEDFILVDDEYFLIIVQFYKTKTLSVGLSARPYNDHLLQLVIYSNNRKVRKMRKMNFSKNGISENFEGRSLARMFYRTACRFLGKERSFWFPIKVRHFKELEQELQSWQNSRKNRRMRHQPISRLVDKLKLSAELFVNLFDKCSLKDQYLLSECNRLRSLSFDRGSFGELLSIVRTLKTLWWKFGELIARNFGKMQIC